MRLNTWEGILTQLQAIRASGCEDEKIALLVELLVNLRLIGQDECIPDLRQKKDDIETIYAQLESETRLTFDAVSQPSDRLVYYAREVIKKLPVRQGAEDMIEQIKSGVTTVVDHHASAYAVEGSLFKIADAAREFGIRSNLCYEISDRDGEAIARAGIKENADFVKYTNEQKDDMLKGLFGFHASMTISDKTLDESLAAAAAVNAGFHVHCAEGIEDVADSLAKYNQRVIERWYKRGVLNDKSIAVHCIHLSSDEIDMLKESNVAVVHNPESNMGNAVGIAPILEMMKRGVLVGLGTDGYTADMTESYKVANIIHKHENKLPSVGWVEPPQMLFDNNKKIVNRFLEGTTGVLKEGAYADVIIVDYKGPTPLNETNLNGHILIGVTGRNVDTTIINGRVVMDERRLVDIDEERIAARSVDLAQKLWNRI